MALHEAGVLELIPVGGDGEVKAQASSGAVYHFSDLAGNKQAIHYHTYVDCVGQLHIPYEDFPFKSLLNSKKISPARLNSALRKLQNRH